MTLIEMLVVLAIIGVIASVSVLAIGPAESTQGLAEAKRLEARLQLAADRAMIEDAELALAVRPTGYALMQWDAAGNAWRTGEGESHALPTGMTLQASEQAPVLPLNAAASGRGFDLTLAQGDRVWRVSYDGVSAHMTAGAAEPVGGERS